VAELNSSREDHLQLAKLVSSLICNEQRFSTTGLEGIESASIANTDGIAML
jgi:hypothetical protein